MVGVEIFVLALAVGIYLAGNVFPIVWVPMVVESLSYPK
jgi:hypothetical protein